MEFSFDTVLGLVVGISLAAACGFRVFLPMLVLSAAAKAGWVDLASGWDWIASWPALTAFAVATGVEITAYYVPWVDNLLDGIASPAAVVAGAIAAAACITDMHPLLQWSAAVIAGGGLAGTIQASTVLLRGASSTATLGLGNFLVSTLEWVMALALAVLAVVVPVLAGAALCLIMLFIWHRFARRRTRTASPTA